MTKSNAQVAADVVAAAAEVVALIPDNRLQEVSAKDLRDRFGDFFTILLDILAREGQANGLSTLGLDGLIPPEQWTLAQLPFASQPEGIAGTAGKVIDAARLAALKSVISGIGSLGLDARQPLVELPKALGRVAALAADAVFNNTTGLWEGTDNQPAIQAAHDAHLYSLISEATKVGVGGYLLGRGLHVCYDGSLTARLFGSGLGYNHDTQRGGTNFVTNFVNEPAISIQGGRNVQVGGFSLSGRLRKFIVDNIFGKGSYVGALDDTDPLNWIDAGLSADDKTLLSSQYAPYAGIAIDPRVGAAQANHYADVTYPAISGISVQYNKGSSSGVYIEKVEIQGYFIGIVAHPNFNSDNNGDFTPFEYTQVKYCVYGIAISHTQARMGALIHLEAANCHTVLTNKNFGKEQGRFGSGWNIHAGSCIRLYDFTDTSNVGPQSFDWYVEECYQEGVLGNTTAVAMPLAHSGRMSWEGQSLRRGIPFWMVDGPLSGGVHTSATLSPYKATGGRSNYYGPTYGIRAPIEGISISGGIQMGPRLFDLETGAAIALPIKSWINATGGGWFFPTFGAGKRIKEFDAKFTPYNLDTGSLDFSVQTGGAFPSSRPITTPAWCARHRASLDVDDEGGIVPQSRILQVNVSSIGLTSAPVTGRSVAGTFPVGWTATKQMVNWGRKGDAILHSSGAVFVMDSRSGSDYTVKLLNGWEKPAGVLGLKGTVDLTNATVALLCCRYYSPARPIYAVITSGSDTLTQAGLNFGGTQDSSKLLDDVSVGDYVVVDRGLQPYLTQTLCSVLAIDETAGTVQLGGNALKTSDGRVRILTFSRAEP